LAAAVRSELVGTTPAEINSALIENRHRRGLAVTGMVLTLAIVTDEQNAHDALQAAGEASREHPCRTVSLIRHTHRP
jgi:glucose-6-phosphate dehydrogenase assembly protein OpcA